MAPTAFSLTNLFEISACFPTYIQTYRPSIVKIKSSHSLNYLLSSFNYFIYTHVLSTSNFGCFLPFGDRWAVLMANIWSSQLKFRHVPRRRKISLAVRKDFCSSRFEPKYFSFTFFLSIKIPKLWTLCYRTSWRPFFSQSRISSRRLLFILWECARWNFEPRQLPQILFLWRFQLVTELLLVSYPTLSRQN